MCRWPAKLLAFTLVVAVVLVPATGSRPPREPMRVIPASPVSSVVIAGRAVWLTSYGGPASAHLLARISDEFGAAVEDVRAFWGGDWPREIAVVLTGTEPQFRAQVGGGDTARQWSDIAAVTVADRVDPVRRLAFGQRIVFAPGALAMSRTALRIVLAHELFHYVARRDTALDAPRWLAEGVADFVARPPVAARGATTPPETLPSDADLDAAGPQRSLAYDRAWLFARFVAATYGIAKLRALYLAACGVDHADLPGALRTVLGTDAAGVLAAWQRWLVG